ncbi:cysteine desulfurase family protein [Haloglomus halophilum]|uniref:cysteine desulfurase family protein n=1 Tax=Haloglomus halophilum TaxID=2962672 RepID=UPI0020C97BF7|nr:cysteine desulfurase family protein [Haloglomus halophilum]
MTEARNRIYLDHHATTPVDQRVVDAMQPYFTEVYANPSNDDDYQFASSASRAVKEARETLGEIFNTHRPGDIVFTSGATESDNLALRGVLEHARANDLGTHFITGGTEHDAIRNMAKRLSAEGFEWTEITPDENGRIDPEAVRDAIREDTLLMSIMAANNEIGTTAPVAELGALAKEEEVLFHTDAVQAVGYRSLDVQELGIDLMSISGHKVYGPKGVGALYIRRRNPQVRDKIQPQLLGGGQEGEIRSGTLNVPGIVGLGKAVEFAYAERDSRTAKVQRLRDRLWEHFQDGLDNVILNGHPEERLPNNLNVSFLGVNNKGLVTNLSENDPEIVVAAGAACSTAGDKTETSHVMRMITDDQDQKRSAIRFGLGKENTEAEIDQAAERIIGEVNRLRNRFDF